MAEIRRFLSLAALALLSLVLRASSPLDAEFSFVLGSPGHEGVALAVDPEGRAVVAGRRQVGAEAFPISENAAQKTAAGIFVAKIDSRGQRMLWATNLGGTRARGSYWRGQLDTARGVATDAQGNTLVVGSTFSLDFPVENAVVAMPQSAVSEGFLTKISADGSRFVYSTYLGGSYGVDVAADALGNAYVAIHAGDQRLPYERLDLGTPGVLGSMVVAKLNPSGQIVFATRFGTPNTTAEALAVDATGAVIVASSSPDRGRFVSKLDPTGSRVVYATALSGAATIKSLAVDSSGAAFVAGATQSPDYPLLHPYQSSLAGGHDYVVTKIGPNGTLEASTYLGGDADEHPYGVLPQLLVGPSGRATLVGATASLSGLTGTMTHVDTPLWRSDDGGRTWAASSAGLRTSTWGFAVSERDRTWYAGSADGLYRSTDGGATWSRTALNHAADVYDVVVDAAHPGTIYATTRSGVFRSDTRGDAWALVDSTSILGGPYHPAGHAALVVDGDGVVFLGSEGIRRSEDGGRTWIDVSSGLERGPTGRYGPVNTIVFDPNVAGWVYALHSSRPYRSQDGGRTWTRLEPVYPPASSYGIHDFYGLAVAAGRRGRLYASGWTELLRSDNDGASWTMLADRGIYRAQFLFHPSRAETMYAFDRWSGAPLLVSENAGDTWVARTLPRAGQRIFVVDPLQPDALFAPAEMRTLPALVTFDQSARRVESASFLDMETPSAAAMDLAGAIYLLRSVEGRAVVAKLR
jgi:photosystem II stability/assembly factor-like uncharacterized protein